jgi:hypothetical protein
MLAFTYNASAFTLNFNDAQDLGWVNPGEPAGTAQEEIYVNTLIGFAQGSGLHSGIDGHDYFRNNTSCGTCVPAVFSSKNDSGSNVVNLGTGGFTYLLAKYDGPNGASEVWNVQGLTGVITIPDFLGQYGLSHWTLFRPGGGVPDGGTTVMLLGMACGALGMTRRFFRI